MVVCVLEIGELQYAAYTKPFIEAYCRRHGYTLVYSDRDFDDSRRPAWNKLLVHRVIDADFVLVMDLDVCPLPFAPPIHDSLDRELLSLVPELPISRHTRRAAEQFHVPPDWLCYNTGLLGVPRTAAPFLEEVHRNADLSREIYAEQGEVCIQIVQQGVPVHDLDRAWNTIPRGSFDPARRDAYFLHFAGNEARRRAWTECLWNCYRNELSLQETRFRDVTP